MGGKWNTRVGQQKSSPTGCVGVSTHSFRGHKHKTIKKAKTQPGLRRKQGLLRKKDGAFHDTPKDKIRSTSLRLRLRGWGDTNSWEASPAAWHHLFQKVSALVSNWNTDNLQNPFWLISLSPRPIYTTEFPLPLVSKGWHNCQLTYRWPPLTRCSEISGQVGQETNLSADCSFPRSNCPPGCEEKIPYSHDHVVSYHSNVVYLYRKLMFLTQIPCMVR